MKKVSEAFLKAVATEFGEEFFVHSIEEKRDRICITLRKEENAEDNTDSSELWKEEQDLDFEEELSFF